MSEFADSHWTSSDGLRLHYRDYPGRTDRPPLLCLPGLTRNARDFEGLAARLAGDWRVICPDLRGRGDSAYAKDSASYNPLQYVDDIAQLFAQAGLERVVAIGTSLGGILTMILAMTGPERLAGAVLNDVGPVIESAGLDRIRGYVGKGGSYPSWVHAARAIAEVQAVNFPDWELADWLVMAKRAMVVGSNGRIQFDYDMKIAEPLSRPGGEAGADLWPGVSALAGKPVLILRGETSDLFAPTTMDRMLAMLPGSEGVSVSRVGHAPTLEEPQSIAAIDRLLARIA